MLARHVEEQMLSMHGECGWQQEVDLCSSTMHATCQRRTTRANVVQEYVDHRLPWHQHLLLKAVAAGSCGAVSAHSCMKAGESRLPHSTLPHAQDTAY
jgi:hypothetical protein